jgi:hypothetical protein
MQTTYDNTQDCVNANPRIITSAQKCALDVRMGDGHHIK